MSNMGTVELALFVGALNLLGIGFCGWRRVGSSSGGSSGSRRCCSRRSVDDNRRNAGAAQADQPGKRDICRPKLLSLKRAWITILPASHKYFI